MLDFLGARGIRRYELQARRLSYLQFGAIDSEHESEEVEKTQELLGRSRKCILRLRVVALAGVIGKEKFASYHITYSLTLPSFKFQSESVRTSFYNVDQLTVSEGCRHTCITSNPSP